MPVRRKISSWVQVRASDFTSYQFLSEICIMPSSFAPLRPTPNERCLWLHNRLAFRKVRVSDNGNESQKEIAQPACSVEGMLHRIAQEIGSGTSLTHLLIDATCLGFPPFLTSLLYFPVMLPGISFHINTALKSCSQDQLLGRGWEGTGRDQERIYPPKALFWTAKTISEID